MLNQQKILKIILIFIGLMIIITSSTFVINSLNYLDNLKFAQVKNNKHNNIDTKNWKTYRNEIIGLEFQYPNTWPTIKPDDRGDIMKDGKTYTSFSLNLPDLSHLDHTFLNYDNLPIDEQYNEIQCQENYPLDLECEDRVSDNGVKYVWEVTQTQIAGITYQALVATGKYILIFDFQEKDNYEKRADQYQKMLSTLKIPK